MSKIDPFAFDDRTLDDISAHSFAIYDCENKRFLNCKKESMKREVASLTKMMTFWTVLKMMHKVYKDPRDINITISKAASVVTGTTANLREGDVLNIEQLCYGMMLPSGNDAAYALAEYFGNIIN